MVSNGFFFKNHYRYFSQNFQKTTPPKWLEFNSEFFMFLLNFSQNSQNFHYLHYFLNALTNKNHQIYDKNISTTRFSSIKYTKICNNYNVPLIDTKGIELTTNKQNISFRYLHKPPFTENWWSIIRTFSKNLQYLWKFWPHW